MTVDFESRPVRVLLVEDDEDDYVLTRDFLNESRRTKFTLDWVATYDEALRAFDTDGYDAYLIDYRLGSRDGLELVREAKRRGSVRPMILITGQTDSDVDVAAMKAGAADYLVKGQVDAQLLERSIRYALEQSAALERLTHDAFHDALTQLPNRALFMDRLGRALENVRRHPTYVFAVLFLDLDRFKVVNDSLGHLMGDELLIGVGRRLDEVVRSSDTVARLGGDEFTILLHEVHGVTDAVRMAHRVQESLSAPFRISQHEVFSTVSIGIAVSATGYENADEILRDADIAMYRAKSRGKARHEVFDRTMHDRAVKLLQVETDLRRALDRGELRLHYQPVIKVSTSAITGFEALLRWHRGDEIVSANEIVPLAEETGLIFSIGEWVLREALRQTRVWQVMREPANPLHIHVNFSTRQFLQPNVVEQIERALHDTATDPRTLHLEVTESLLIDNAESAGELLQRLKAAHVCLSLDDFGTGYSSLSMLQQFPFDTLKIDRAFISAHTDSERAHEIVRTIASLARALGMAITVEGVESEPQLARVRELGIDYAQGFYFSPPVDAAHATELLRAESLARG